MKSSLANDCSGHSWPSAWANNSSTVTLLRSIAMAMPCHTFPLSTVCKDGNNLKVGSYLKHSLYIYWYRYMYNSAIFNLKVQCFLNFWQFEDNCKHIVLLSYSTRCKRIDLVTVGVGFSGRIYHLKSEITIIRKKSLRIFLVNTYW